MKRKWFIVNGIVLLTAILTAWLFYTAVCYQYGITVKVHSDFKTSFVTWGPSGTGKVYGRFGNAGWISHLALYGIFYYHFNIYVEGEKIPVCIQIFHACNFSQDINEFRIRKGKNDSEIIVDIGNYRSEVFDLSQDHGITVGIGP